MKKIWIGAVFICTIICIGGILQADASTVLNNTYSGWYDASGNHDLGNQNYYSGNLSGIQLNNFFVFDLSGVSGTVWNARFNVFSYAISVPGTYTIYGTALDPSIKESCIDCVGNYNGLTSGPAIGSIVVGPEDAYSNLAILLNDAGLAWLQANEGTEIVLGGSFPQISNGTEKYIFGYSDFTENNNLTINTPEPTTLLLLGSGLVGLAGLARRRFQKR